MFISFNDYGGTVQENCNTHSFTSKSLFQIKSFTNSCTLELASWVFMVFVGSLNILLINVHLRGIVFALFYTYMYMQLFFLYENHFNNKSWYFVQRGHCVFYTAEYHISADVICILKVGNIWKSFYSM